MRFQPIASIACILTLTASCSLDREGALSSDGVGGSGVAGAGATGGAGGTQQTGGSGGTGGFATGGDGGSVTGGTGGMGGVAGSGGAAGMGGTAATGGSAGVAGSGGSAGSAGGAGLGGTSGAAGWGGTAGTGGTSTPCEGQCTDPNATCTSDQCNCKAGFTNLDSDGNPATATCVANDTIVDVVVTVGIDHTRLGDLVVKLVAPEGTTITLVNRAGYDEPADDGAGDQEGDFTDLDGAYPIKFTDAAQYSAEDMGQFINPADLAVCRDNSSDNGGPGTKICQYRISPGAAGGPTTLAGGLGKKPASGTWQLCAGDAVHDRSGTLQSFSLSVATVSGSVTASASSLGANIPDNAYNGSLGSMACTSLSL